MSFSMGEVSASGPFFTCSSPLSGFRCSREQFGFKSWYAHGKNTDYSSLARSHCRSGSVLSSIQSRICGRSLTHVMYSRAWHGCTSGMNIEARKGLAVLVPA